MFRTPREAAGGFVVQDEAPILPSVGRPPTPPSDSTVECSSPMASTAAAPSPVTPLLGRAKTTIKTTPSIGGKGKMKSNGNIMNFFKKAETTCEDQSLFFESGNSNQTSIIAQVPTPPHDLPSNFTESNESLYSDIMPSPSRYNEQAGPVKRQKIVADGMDTRASSNGRLDSSSKGPFLDDSDDEEQPASARMPLREKDDIKETFTAEGEDEIEEAPNSDPSLDTKAKRPSLKRESTSVGNLDEFDGIEDFMDEEFAENGEEFLERRFMEEQAELERAIEDADEEPSEADPKLEKLEECATVLPQDATAACCPICGGDTTGMSAQQVSVHVNDCLDGKAKPLPERKIQAPPTNPSAQTESKAYDDPQAPKRLQRAAIARPGQANPFSLTQALGSNASAFSKLMSGNAEDNAWAEAAASESASRGKPAYQRTCPFYKIMPGFFTCVDAFRYGAVQGCNAYFLSHFHSDHYIGLTSSWCHGPIYCSRVTANLVRRQLKVDPKWVVDLRFEEKVEIPNTEGMEVTMIPANHCPGSSLFLFEKAIGRGKTPKVQRVLHCGDFRACPAHVKHPKLRPEFLDHVTGKLAHQKIDVCYLDTTYLTPKYAFPSQEKVINACAQMCVSLSKEIVDSGDSWETVKRERAGKGMVNFVQKASIKDEPTDSDVPIKTEEGDSIPPLPEKKPRGRLLVIVGTYSIGKERICLGVAKALGSKIYAPPSKQRIVAALEDPELSALMTSDPYEAQVHMQMLMEIRAETLADYLVEFKPHFSRIVGFRPSGWNYRPPNSRFTESPAVQTVLHSENWKSQYSMHELVPQRGSTSQAMCFGVPYSEHSSFRELTMFCCSLRIDRIIPTVNVGSAKSRERMKGWCEKWAVEKKKNGLYRVGDDIVNWS